MRIRTGHRPTDWSEVEPSELALPIAPALGGSFVVGEPGPVEMERRNMSAYRKRVREDPERYAQRQATWHASKVRHGRAAA